MTPFLGLALSGLLAAAFAVEPSHDHNHKHIQSRSTTSSTGCGTALPPGIAQGGTGDSNHFTFDVSDGTTRTYLLHIPPTYDINRPVGLIWSYAGHSESALEQESISQFSNPSFNPDMLAVYPEGTKNAQGETQWQGDPEATGVNDVQFTLELLDHLLSKYCIDDTQVFASGKSNGGGFAAHVLPCDENANSRFAAYAAASGAFYVLDEAYSTAATCNPKTVPISCPGASSPARLPLIETHGGSDTTISYAGGLRKDFCLPEIPHYVRFMAGEDGLAETNVSTALYDGHVEHYVFGEDTKHAGEVQSYYVPSMGHCWPSTLDNMDCVESTYFNATPIFMEFFRKWPLPESPSSGKENATASSPPASTPSTDQAHSGTLGLRRVERGSKALVGASVMLAFTA